MDGEAALSRSWLDAYLRSFPGVTTDYKAEWGFLHYRVGGRIFAIICTPGERYRPHAGRTLVTLRCDERAMSSILNAYCDAVPGFYSDHRFWFSVYLDGDVPDSDLRALCAQSYEEAEKRLSARARRQIQGETS